MYLSTVSVLLSVAYFATTEGLNDDIIVELREGKIRGHILKTWNGTDYYGFQEIPYAAPPLKENRFQLPKQVNPWTGVLNTTKNTKICIQRYSKHSNLAPSEDCLYLNVYTPVKPGSNSEKLPVLVWIHGGVYEGGSGAFDYFGPQFIMDHGLVVVTLNYRLGLFGFATTEDGVVPANLGLKDQKLALAWVSENIHLFSGDSQKVTLAGQSAGSFSVGLHVLAQKDNKKELFHAAIMQSGSPIGGLVQDKARENIFNCGRALDESFTSNQSSDLLKVLQEASAADILEVCGEATGTVIEKGGDYSYAPYQSFMDGSFRKIPILMGFTSEEWLYAVSMEPNVNNTLISFDNDPSNLVPTLINMSPKNKTIAGKLLKELYTETSFENNLGAYCRWSSDSVMTSPICKQAELTASQMPVYLYQFSYDGDLGRIASVTIPGAERVFHSEDYPYLWDIGNNSDLRQFSEEDQLTLWRFVKMWTNFVKYQNPTPENDILLNNLRWPTTNGDNLPYLNFNATLEISEYPRQYVKCTASAVVPCGIQPAEIQEHKFLPTFPGLSRSSLNRIFLFVGTINRKHENMTMIE